MNEFKIEELCDKLQSLILNIIYSKPEERKISPNYSHLSDMKDVLNLLFAENSCTDVLYTLNTDTAFFGVRINPQMSANDAMIILTTEDRVKLNKYQLELDSKLFDIDLAPEEITAVILYEISSMMDSYEIIDTVRALVDLHLLSNDDIISIRDSVNYSQLIIYALKDTLYKVSSLLFKEDIDELTSNKLIQSANLVESLISAREKITSSNFGAGDSLGAPQTIILRWMFTMYKNMKLNSNIVVDTLKDAASFTSSRLVKSEINKTIQAVDRIDSNILIETNLIKALEVKGFGAVTEASLFKGLKQSGLKSIEDALYEFALRIKNCDTEEDAMYIVRGINTRLSILEDYLYNTPDISDQERKRYELVAMRYREMREELVKRRIVNKKQYGLFFDYDKLYPEDQQNNNY